MEVRSAGLLQQGDDLTHALVLGDHVAKPAPCDLVDPRLGRSLLCAGCVQLRRAARADCRQRPLELGPAIAVPTLLELVADARVEDDERDSGRQRDEPVLLRRTVEEQRMAFAAQECTGRVHQSHRHADREPLGGLGDPRELDALELVRRRLREGEPD